jgi:hypothetical protein
MILSVSRRCDIPRFQFDWFREQLDAGFVDVANPFNSRQVRRVSLLPADAEVLVFWTRDPRPVLNHGEELEARGFRFYVMCTLTGYPEALEPSMPEPEQTAAVMGLMAEKWGPRRVIWRYDPLFLSSLTDGDFHRRNFKALAGALKGAVRRVMISVYDEYPRAQGRILRREAAGAFEALPHYDGEGRLLPEVRGLLGDLAEIAGAAGMEIYACAEGEDLTPLGIRRGACIDGGLIRELWGIESPGKDPHQRPFCGCAPSVDIGRYGPCPAGCVYCYARR